jgi:hypothetical protein
MGSILFLLLAVVACSSTATPSPSASRRPMASAKPSPTASPTPTPRPSPRPMAQATLTPGREMTMAREGQTAVRLADGRVLIMGGYVPITPQKCGMACVQPRTSSVEIYEPSPGKFSPNGSLAEPLLPEQSLLLNDGHVLVYGDNFSTDDPNTIEIYDPARGTSTVVKPPAGVALPFGSTVVLLADGRVLIAGGSLPIGPYGSGGNTTSKMTLMFDPKSGGLSAGPSMAEPREGALGTLLDDGRVLMVGGEYWDRTVGIGNDNAELIDPSRPLSQSTLLKTSQHPETSTLLSDGRVLVMEYGGPAGGTDREVSEIFDPRAEKFTPVGPMSTPRTGSLTAIRIPDGRVLVFGAYDAQNNAVTTVEAFDPDSETFQVIATGFPAIQGFSATLLDDGEILFAGGGNGKWNGMTAATWLLKP